MTGVKNITLLVLPQTLDESNIWWNVQTTNGVYYKEYNAETLNLLWATNKNSAIFTTTYWKKIEDEYVKLNSVADTKNVGEYKIIVSVNDNYTIEDSKTTELNVVVNQKYIKVVASSLTDEESLGYYDKENIPSLDNLIYNIYDSEEDKWKKENLKFKLVYKSTEDNSIVEIDKIKEEWDNWTYKDGVVQPKNYIIYIERRSDLENYIIDYRDGVMTIEKKSFSVIFQIDGKYSVSKTFLQTELIVAPDLSFAPNITTSTKLTNWYLNGNEVSDISSIKLNKNITLNKYTIYTITYEINSATEENPVYEFHKEKKSVNEHPLKDYDSKLSKFGYEFKGWASTNGNILDYYSINTTGLEKDMVLRPQYETKKYNIVLASVKITEELDKNGNIVKVESKPSEFARETFTIVDYDSNQLITLDGQEIVEEGFIFKNWYYNNVKLENGSFRLSEIIERSDLDNLDSNGIQIIAKFEVLKCVVVLMVGNTPIKNISYDIGDNIDKDDLMSLIDRKFGYLYVMEDVPDVVNSSSIIVIRVSEIPFLYISLGVIVILGGLVTLLVVIIRKKKLAKDKKELDTILNHLD